jgi:hypothetical protein
VLSLFVVTKCCSYTNKGMVRSDMSKPALIFFFTARVHTTKSTIKILAANTRCKYFLKIAEVTHFFCTRNGLYQRFVQPLLALTGSLTLGSEYERSYHYSRMQFVIMDILDIRTSFVILLLHPVPLTHNEAVRYSFFIVVTKMRNRHFLYT